MATVTGTYLTPQGDPAQGTVYISLCRRLPNGATIRTEKRVYGDLDINGAISLDVIPSTDPDWHTDSAPVYLVEERLMGLPFRSYWIGVPDAGVDLSAVQHVDPDVAPMPVPGPQGPQGIQGPEGPQGPPGADGQDFTPADADARYVNTTGDTMTGALTVPTPTAAQHVPRLARTPNPATGDLGLPGYAGSDTGWWDVTSLLANGWGVEASGFAKIRRVGSTVTFVIRNVSQPGTNQTAFALPVGFRFGTEYGVTRYFDSTASNTPGGASISGNNVNLPTTWTGGTTTRQVVCSGTVSEDWPTSLPGTQVTPPATWT